MSWREIEVAREDEVAIVRLARPARLNAYTPDMGDELVEAFEALLADPSVRAVVLTGAGRAFCAGADRDFIAGARGARGHRLGEEPFLCGFAERLATADKPLVAAVNGPAVGLGATMTLAFDARLCAAEARFEFPFARLGMMPGMGATYLLPRLVGESCARRLLLSGGGLDAAAAVAAGLASEITPAEALAERAVAFARTLIGRSPEIVAALKRALIDREALARAVRLERAEIDRLAEDAGAQAR